MATIDLNGALVLRDGTFLISEIQGSQLQLRNTQTNEETTVHIADIPLLLVDPPQLPNVDISALEPLLKHRKKKELQPIRNLEAHLKEVLTGNRTDLSGEGAVRPEYDPATTSLNNRILAKSKELAYLGIPASPSTIKRKIRAYEQGGLAGLIDGRSLRKQSSFRKMTPELRASFVRVINARTTLSTQRKKAINALVREEFWRANPDFDGELPSDRTMYRYQKVLTTGKYTTGNAKTRRTAANSPAGPATSARPMHPGQEVQIDSNRLDIMVVDEDGNAGRPVLTLMLDVATRSIIAVTLRMVAAKAVDHAFILVQAALPHGRRPGDDDLWELTRLLHPGLELWSKPEWSKSESDRAAQAKPFILPECVIIDNGADFRSPVFQAAAGKLGMGIPIARPYTPTDKRIIERLFLTIKDEFIAGLPGYVGGAVNERGEKPEQDDLLTLPELSEQLEEWISIVYQNQTHEGLRAPMAPHVAVSPNQMYRAMSGFSGQVPIPVTPDQYIGFLPLKNCVIGPEGVFVNYRKYNSAELQTLRWLPSDRPSKNRKWEVRYNPYNPLFVWVRNPEGAWIECVWRERDTFQQPFSGKTWEEAVRFAKENATQGSAEEFAAFKESLAAAKAAIRKTELRNQAAQEQAAAEGTPMPTGTAPPEPEEPPIPVEADHDASGRPIIHFGVPSRGGNAR